MRFLTQTGALFVDAYRDLNSRKMFWITMVLSGVVVVAFAGVSINERGIKFFTWEFPGIYNTTLVPAPAFYKALFSGVGVGWWLNVFAIALALISTAGIIPDLIAGGSVDLYLSKPLSRTRLFLSKYVFGLLFVGLQVLVFTVACFLLIGFRTGTWDAKVFLSIPVAVCVFSYLFCICALLGLITRSTIAALLLTLLFWGLLFGINATEKVLLLYKIAADQQIEGYRQRFAWLDTQEKNARERVARADKDGQAELDRVLEQRRKLEEKKRNSDPGRHGVTTAYGIFSTAYRVLPKTSDTSNLLVVWLGEGFEAVDEEQMRRRDERRATRRAANGFFSAFRGDATDRKPDDTEVMEEVGDNIRARSTASIIGTSLAFEAVVLTLACWIFVRRDY